MIELGLGLAFIAGWLLRELLQPAIEKHARPYDWECPESDCDFRVASSDIDTTETLVHHHREMTRHDT